MKQKWFVALTVLLAFVLACGTVGPTSVPTVNPDWTPAPDLSALEIQATDEMLILQNAGIFADFAKQPGGVPVNLHTEKGSVELQLEISGISENNPSRVHAYITSDPFFMPGTAVRDKKPIMMSLTTLSVTRAKMAELGWSSDVEMAQVISAAAAGQLNVCSASPSQDAASLNFYLAALTALKGNGETLRIEDLEEGSPVVQRMRPFYDALAKSDFNSETLRQTVLAEFKEGSPSCDAVVLPESSALVLNSEFVAAGIEPMQLLYILDATSAQIYTMGCVDGISPDKIAQCQALEKFLASADVLPRIVALGFRANDVGYAVPNAPALFNADWGVRTDEPLTVDMPKDAVVEEAISVYQTVLKPGSYICYVLDFSPSMDDNHGKDQLLTAMQILLDQTAAEKYNIEVSPKDTICAVLFSDSILAERFYNGSQPELLYGLTQPEYLQYARDDVNKEHPLNPYDEFTLFGQLYYQSYGSGTNIYGSVQRGTEIVMVNAHPDQFRAVIFMTDGEHNWGPDYDDLERFVTNSTVKIPVYTIAMGEAKEQVLQDIADLTGGQYCDGRGGEEQLARCFRQFKAGN